MISHHPTILTVALGSVLCCAAPAGAQSTTLLSKNASAIIGNANSSRPSISYDGTLIAFASEADNLVPGDTNFAEDVFVYNRLTGVLTRASTSAAGVEGNGKSGRPDIAGNGGYVTFYSDSDNFVAGDTNVIRDVYIKNLQTGAIVRGSVSTAGAQTNGESTRPRLSADGRFLVFSSDGTTLVPGDTNLAQDTFLRDRDTDQDGIFDEPGSVSTVLASLTSTSALGNASSGVAIVSDNGRWVAFRSDATNLVPGDTNLAEDVFVRDMVAGTTVRVSVSSAGVQGDLNSSRPMMSADGRFVTFFSRATNLVPADTNQHCAIDSMTGMLVCEPARDCFVHDRDADADGILDEPGSIATVRVSVADDGSQADDRTEDPDISADGRWVTFWTDATNLVANDLNGVRDVILHDRDTDEDGIYDEPGAIENILVSVTTTGTQSNDENLRQVVSADGRFVAFRSNGTNMVPGDTNLSEDVLLRDVTGDPPVGTWTNLGNALAGTNGLPLLVGTGTLIGGDPVTLTLSNAKASSTTALIIGFAAVNAPFKGGILVPLINILVTGLPTFGGTLPLAGAWPTGLPSNFTIYYQHWIVDPAGPVGFAASNAISSTTP